MTDIPPADLLAHLPAGLTSLQRTITRLLVRHSCTAGIRRQIKGDIKRGSIEFCAICLEDLANELTLRHAHDSHVPIWGAPIQRACQRTYHFSCLLEWAESNLQQKRPVTCPGDRQLLMPVNVSEEVYNHYRIQDPPRHDIREIDNVVRFWDLINPNIDNPPECRFEVTVSHPEEALRMASIGFDVGLISDDAVHCLPLDDRTRTQFNIYDQVMTRAAGRDRQGRQLTQPAFCSYIYIEQGRDLIDHRTGYVATDFLLIPVKEAAGRIFRRYLLGMLGEAYSIEINRRGRLNVHRMILDDDEVINLHAETEIRKLMTQARSQVIPPASVTWYWPFPNEGGGVVLGGTLPDRQHPARGYLLDGLNIGLVNDHRFSILAADPNINARERSDALVNDYRHGNLPEAFPVGWEVVGHANLQIAYAPREETTPPIVTAVPFLGPWHAPLPIRNDGQRRSVDTQAQPAEQKSSPTPSESSEEIQ